MGISLFIEIRWNRTCEQVGIPEGHFACNHESIPLSVDDSWEKLATKLAVKCNNKLLAKFESVLSSEKYLSGK